MASKAGARGKSSAKSSAKKASAGKSRARTTKARKTTAKKKASSTAKTRGRNQPLLARVSVAVRVPPGVTLKEVLAQAKTLDAHWTAATYTQGPNGTQLDDPAGLDFP